MVEPNNIAANIDLNELGEGSALLLWAFRSCICGQACGNSLPAMFDRHFGEQGPDVLRYIFVLAQTIGSKGHRKVTLVHPNSARVTQDEVSLLRAAEAAQTGHSASVSAQMTWLMAGGPISGSSRAILDIAKAFSQRGLFIRSQCESPRRAASYKPAPKPRKSSP